MDATWTIRCAPGGAIARTSIIRALITLCAAALLFITATPAARAQARMTARTDGMPEVELPLVEEGARVEIDQQHATTTLRYVYENRTGRRVEGRFAFRTGEGANVDGFSYWNGEQKIVGEVLETGAARRIYDSVQQRRRDPGLLEKTGDGSFSFKVFPIEPGEKKRIEIRLDQWLPRRDRAVEYRLSLARPSAEVEVVVRDERKVRRVTSATHAIGVGGAGSSEARVRVGEARAWGAQRELALRYELGDGAFALHAHAHKDRDQQGYFVATLAAPAIEDKLSQDLTFVLDVSATMAGGSVDEARVTAGRMIQRLRASDRLNVILAGTRTRKLFATPRWATKQVRDEVLSVLLGVYAEGGRADLADAISTAFAAQERVPRNKTVLLLTDGRSGVAPAFQVAERDTSDARLFTVGFGSQVDRPALSRLAGLKQGRFTLIESGDAIASRADRLSQWIAVPVLRRMSIEATGAVIRETYPRSLADLYPGQEIRVVGRFEGNGPARISLHGQGDRAFTFSATIDPSREPRRPWIGKLWARERVDHLLEQMSGGAPREPMLSETIELALAYNIVTPYTSFLAIPESELNAASAAELGSARRHKQRILALNPDAAAIGGPGARPAAAPPAMAYAEAEERPIEPSASKDMGSRDSGGEDGLADGARIRHGACAGCEVGAARPNGSALVIAAVALALAAIRRSRRR